MDNNIFKMILRVIDIICVFWVGYLIFFLMDALTSGVNTFLPMLFICLFYSFPILIYISVKRRIKQVMVSRSNSPNKEARKETVKADNAEYSMGYKVISDESNLEKGDVKAKITLAVIIILLIVLLIYKLF